MLILEKEAAKKNSKIKKSKHLISLPHQFGIVFFTEYPYLNQIFFTNMGLHICCF